jgi:hypothetical protein
MKNILTSLFLLFTLPSCNQQGEQEIYILPQNYTGRVLVIFDQKSGEPEKYEAKARVYVIPQTGILKTRFSINEGWKELPRFYYVEMDEKRQIPVQVEYTKLSSDKVNATLASTGVAYKNINGTGEIQFKECYVGTKEQIEEAHKKAEKLDILDLIKSQ